MAIANSGGRKKKKKIKNDREQMVAAAPEMPTIEPMVDDLPQTPSDKLALIVGTGPISLRQANQIVWAYVQRKGFQDTVHKHMIHVQAKGKREEPLKGIVGENPISMFELTEKLRKHLS